ncbi:hypothetical protein ACFLZQ_05235 [Thermodesulfobacteriota bacterium]
MQNNTTRSNDTSPSDKPQLHEQGTPPPSSEAGVQPGIKFPDLESLKLSQDFGKGVGVRKALTVIPVRKPNRQEFVRVHPDENFQISTALIELKEEGESYIVAPTLWSELPGEIVPKILLTTVNRQGVLTLWPIRLPDADGRIDNWNRSALEAAHLARSQWLRVAANRSLGGYDTYIATGDLPDPEWPVLSMQEIMDVAFRGYFIDSLSHPVIRRLRGDR